MSEKYSQLPDFTSAGENGNMQRPDRHIKSTGVNSLESKKGERMCLSGDSTGTRSPFLDFNPNNEFVSADATLDYLAEILVEIYLNQYNDSAKEEGSNLLPGVN